MSSDDQPTPPPDPSNADEAGSGRQDASRPSPPPSRLPPPEAEAETFIGQAPPSAAPRTPPSQPAGGTSGGPTGQPPASAPPGKPGAWSTTGSTLLSGGRQPPNPAVSDSWDQSANAATVPPGGTGSSGFGSAEKLDRGRIGPYPIESELGRGGMGVVYLGRDEKLGRPVAIKVLPDMFAQHPERLARFEREARLLASLNHANIAAIYELGEDEGSRFLTLEFVPGQTLAERLTPGELPMDESLHICAQIAEGLEAAHEKGVIHRDLKPGNVKITPEGIVKVLDFGLAKSSGPDSVAEAPSDSPTGSIGNTQEGMILGTAGYMSPEQARGRALDKRTDVWSFGCVLYECLTGRGPFTGDTVSDTIALILRTDPDWSALPPETPDRVRELLQRCFIKDPKRRLRDLGEARIELQSAHESVSSFGAAAPASGSLPATPTKTKPAQSASPDSWWQYVPWAMAGLSVAVAAMVTAALLTNSNGGGSGARNAAVAGVLRFAAPLPGATSPAVTGAAPTIAISDSERWLVIAGQREGRRGLFARAFDREAFGSLPALAGMASPFFSPDSAQLGMTRGPSIHRIPTAALTGESSSGSTVVVENAGGEISGAAWTGDDEIVFAVASGSGAGLYKASAQSTARAGELVLATGSNEQFASPRAVNGQSDLVIYTAVSPSGASIRWLPLSNPSDGGVLVERGRDAYLVGRGAERSLVYAVGGSLVAQRVRVSSSSIVTSGSVENVQDGIATDGEGTRFAVSDDGLLTYLPASAGRRGVRAVAIQGEPPAEALAAASAIEDLAGPLRIDPADPGRVAYISADPSAPIKVVSEGRATRIQSVIGRVTSLAWRPRDRGRSSLTFTVFDGSQTAVMEWDEASGRTRAVSDRASSLNAPLVHGWDSDGSDLYVSVEGRDSGRDILKIGEYTNVFVNPRPGDESDASLSADGERLAFVLTSEGSPRVYIGSTDAVDPDAALRQDRALPAQPSWSPLWLGDRLFVMRPDGLHSVELTDDASRPFGSSSLIDRTGAPPPSVREYDAAPDGSWLLIPVSDDSQAASVRVVVNFDDLVAQALEPSP